MHLIDEKYTRTPFYGSRKMTAALRRDGYRVNRKRVQRLMRLMGIEAIYPKPFSKADLTQAIRYIPIFLRVWILTTEIRYGAQI